ncbi:SIR2 family NAD-dependent protein deacylase [Methanocella arvoryzae]|nr:SIR2 family protein [Methanocella arvoryzae]
MANDSLSNNLIEKIRNREIILWVGSGLSFVAGYPSAKRLGAIIKEHVTPEQLKHFDDKELDGIAEEYVQIYSREKLINILSDVFQKEPNIIDYHKMISEIPQIEVIVTTNYDKLFEMAYANNILKIVTDSDIAKSANDNIAHLYKIHGCIDSPDNIIITKSDYTGFFTNGQYNLLWSALKVLASKYSILFIGYSFEDQNVKYVFEDVLKQLGDNHKDYFLISPDFPEHKQQVLKQYSIEYIQMKAEDAIPKIYKEINEHLIDDGIKGRIPLLKWQKALEDRKIEVVSSLEGGKVSIKKIGTKDNSVKAGGTIHFKTTNDNRQKINELFDVINGKKIGQVKLSKEFDDLDLKTFFGESIFIGGEEFKIEELEIKSPVQDIRTNFILKKSKLSFENVPGEKLNTGTVAQIKLHPPGFDFILDFKVTENVMVDCPINFTFHIDNVLQGYQALNFFNEWIKGDELLIYINLIEKPLIIPFSNINIEKTWLDSINFMFFVYNILYEIQNEFNIILNVPKEFSDEELDDIRVVNSLIKQKRAKLKSFKININSKELQKMNMNEIMPKLLLTYDSITFGLFDKKFEYKNCSVYFEDAYINNKDEVLKQMVEGIDEPIVELFSNCDKIVLIIEQITLL